MGNCCSSNSKKRRQPKEAHIREQLHGEVKEDVRPKLNVQPSESAPLDGVQLTSCKAESTGEPAQREGSHGGIKKSDNLNGEDDSDELKFFTLPFAFTPREVGEPSNNGTPDEEREGLRDAEDTATGEFEFVTVQGSPLSFNQSPGQGDNSAGPCAGLCSMDTMTEPIEMSDLFMSCRSFHRAASSMISGTQPLARLPSERSWRLSLPPRPATRNEDASEAAFMSCRSVPLPTPFLRDPKVVGWHRSAPFSRGVGADSSHMLPQAQNNVTFERFSSVAASSARAGTPEMRDFSRMESRNESLLWQSCISVPSMLFTRDDKSLQTPMAQPTCGLGQSTLQGQKEACAQSLPLSSENLSPMPRFSQLQQKKLPPIVAARSSLPDLPLYPSSKGSRGSTHAVSYASFRWKKNFLPPQSSGPSSAAQSSAGRRPAEFTGTALTTRPRKGRLSTGHAAGAMKYVRGASCVEFGYQSPWAKLADMRAKSTAISLSSQTTDGRDSTGSHEGSRRGSVQKQERREDEEKELVDQSGHGEDDDTLKERQEGLSCQFVDPVIREPRGKDAGTFSNTGGVEDSVAPEAVGKGGSPLQAVNTWGTLHADAFAASRVSNGTKTSVPLGEGTVDLEQPGLNEASEAEEGSNGGARMPLAEVNDMKAGTALPDGVVEQHPEYFSVLSPPPILSIASAGCNISSEDVDGETYGDDSSANRIGDSVIGDQFGKDTGGQHEFDAAKRSFVA
ncbi:hypothetical protein TcG_01618 [Trypanosoma cruzi]|nr:hypothetical protein TcG_01618 [Trypanosoma cruzi]